MLSAPEQQQESQARPMIPDGDALFVGVYMRGDPGRIPPGYLANGQNIRCRKGVAATRKGLFKPPWACKLIPSQTTAIQAWGTIYGRGIFKDVNGGIEWLITAADGGITQSCENNVMTSIPLPTGVAILSPCNFVQAFNVLFCFRGQALAPLILTSLDTGFVDLITQWNAATSTYVPVIGNAAASQVSLGPMQTVQSLTSVGLTATATFATAHGFVTGADVTIFGAAQNEYNGRYNITVTSDTTFTYQFVGSGTATATGTITATNMAQYWTALGTLFAVPKITFSGTTATVTCNGHGFSNGDSVTIAGATGADAPLYNGTFVISNVATNTFQYTMTSTPGANATGTLTVRNNTRVLTGFAPIVTIVTASSITFVTTTATVTANGHGFVNGDSVTIAGATGADGSDYNGTFTISGVTTNTFQYTMPGTPSGNASGTLTARNNTRIVAGPGVTSSDWVQALNILPNADTAARVGARLLVPTAYDPATGLYATKVDVVVATDILDYIHFDFVNQFRINQGEDDAIVDLGEFSEDNSQTATGTCLVFKNKSVKVLDNINFVDGTTGDLNQVTLRTVVPDYGLCAKRAWTVYGNNAYYVSSDRGVISIQQTIQNKQQSMDKPLSDDIDGPGALIPRIAWQYGSQIRMGAWDSKLYVSVPLDNAVVNGVNLIPPGALYAHAGGGIAFYQVTGLVIGKTYSWTPDPQVTPGTITINFIGGSLTSAGTFTATGTTATISISSMGGLYSIVGGALQFYATGVCNAILVYDFLNGAWQGYDTGPAVIPQEFFRMSVQGRQRLFFFGVDGYANLVEENDLQDDTPNSASASGTLRVDFSQYALSRGYTSANYLMDAYRIPNPQGLRHKRGRETAFNVATQFPTLTVNVVYPGVNDRKNLLTNQTRSQTNYFKPWNAAPWVTTNANNDFNTPNREDYTLIEPFFLGNSGCALNQLQEWRQPFYLRGHPARFVQFELINTTGIMELRGHDYEAQPTQRRKGVMQA